MIKHINMHISSRVHNVGYRFSCMETASKMNITGFVRNKRDGSVYLEAEGTANMIDAFIEWCINGPVWAKVTDYKLSEGEIKNFRSFEIIR